VLFDGVELFFCVTARQITYRTGEKRSRHY
jgi:hypothetical protein